MRLSAIVLLTLAAIPLIGQTDWPSYGHDAGGQRYSSLTQINAANVARLKLKWQYAVTPPANSARTAVVPAIEVTPLAAGGMIYFPTNQRSVVALEPESGK